MPTLNQKIIALSGNFTRQVVDAVRGVPLSDLVGSARVPGRAVSTRMARTARVSKGDGVRLRRRSGEEIAASLGSLVALLRKSPGGLRAEQIRVALKLDRRELPRILQEGLRTKALGKKGQKRATVYRAK